MSLFDERDWEKYDKGISIEGEGADISIFDDDGVVIIPEDEGIVIEPNIEIDISGVPNVEIDINDGSITVADISKVTEGIDIGDAMETLDKISIDKEKDH